MGFHFTLPLDFTEELCAMTFDWIFAGDAHAYSVVGEVESAVGARLLFKKDFYVGCDRRPQRMVRRA